MVQYNNDQRLIRLELFLRKSEIVDLKNAESGEPDIENIKVQYVEFFKNYNELENSQEDNEIYKPIKVLKKIGIEKVTDLLSRDNFTTDELMQVARNVRIGREAANLFMDLAEDETQSIISSNQVNEAYDPLKLLQLRKKYLDQRKLGQELNKNETEEYIRLLSKLKDKNELKIEGENLTQKDKDKLEDNVSIEKHINELRERLDDNKSVTTEEDIVVEELDGTQERRPHGAFWDPTTHRPANKNEEHEKEGEEETKEEEQEQIHAGTGAGVDEKTRYLRLLKKEHRHDPDLRGRLNLLEELPEEEDLTRRDSNVSSESNGSEFEFENPLLKDKSENREHLPPSNKPKNKGIIARSCEKLYNNTIGKIFGK